jgi:hypothetical protein
MAIARQVDVGDAPVVAQLVDALLVELIVPQRHERGSV